MITIIAALSEHDGKYVIGKDGDLPWPMKKARRLDMKRFAELTAGKEGEPGHPVIMGRKTWESLEGDYQPLPGRMNYVLTRNEKYSVAQPGAFTCRTLDEALLAADMKTPFMKNIDYDHVYIIGGSSIYQECLERANRMELTFMHTSYDGDAFFPKLDFAQIDADKDDTWKLVKEVTPEFKNPAKGLTFRTYEKK